MKYSLTFLPLGFALASAQTPLVERSPSASPDATPSFLLKPGKDNTKCLTASSSDEGASVTIADCTVPDIDENQRWTFSGSPSYQVKTLGGQKCLAVPTVVADGAKLHISNCSSAAVNQKFWYMDDQTLVWKDHGKCVGLTDGDTFTGNHIQYWSCSFLNPNQIWNAIIPTTDNNNFVRIPVGSQSDACLRGP